MHAAIEATPRPYEHVRRSTGAPQHLIGEAAGLTLRWGIVGHNEEQVVIAVGPGLASGLRAKQVDALW